MKLRLSVLHSGGAVVDVTVTADSTVTVGDVAFAIGRRDPARTHGALPGSTPVHAAPGGGGANVATLRVHPSGEHGSSLLVDAGLGLPDSGIRSGMTVSLASASEAWRGGDGRLGDGAAALTVHSGPDTGRTFPLRAGTNYVGRGTDADVRLSDPLVSKRHARVTIGESVEIADAGSANGLLVDGQRVQRAVLRPKDSVILGDTAVSVTGGGNAAATASLATSDVNFNRSPRLDPTYEGQKFVAPEPPELPKRNRFPVLAMLAPLVMGVVLYAVTRSVLSIVFIGLSPLLMLGSYIDNRVTQRRETKAATKQFDESVAAMHDDIASAHGAERAGRLAETPATADAVDAIRRRTPLLWTRRLEHERFLTVRLGLGEQPSRQEVELPSHNKTKAEHWKALQGLATHAATVTDVPVVADIRDCGAIGVAGPRAVAHGVARGIVAQFVALHSPADLVVVAITSADDADEWAWLKWLPHCGSPHSPLTGPHLGCSAQDATVLTSEIEELIGARGGSAATPSDGAPGGPAVLLVLQAGAPVDYARLVGLCEAGPAAGVYVLWVAGAQEQLPAACRDFVVVDPSDGSMAAGFVKTAVGVTPLECETVGSDDAAISARLLAPVADAGARVDDDSDLPHAISLLSLIGPEISNDSQAVIALWNESVSITDRSDHAAVRKRPPGLLATIGQGAVGPMTIDLRSQGPHALVGGTTGSGKSEFLQAWVLALAAGYSPDALTFLFVDYKGGAAFADCINLPHSVGLVTDLSPHLVQRALTSLNAELHYRERILQQKKAKDLLELQRRGDRDAPPSLVIVVDEFAALVQEVPEFVDGVVNVAQRGRSLGLHLILATQRPAGVIKDNLRANTNLRIALRMADEDDSTDVLDDALAASFSPEIPGRAAVKTGPGRITPFQTGYAGGWTSDEPPPAQLDIRELAFGAGRAWEEPDVPGSDRGSTADHGPTDIARLVSAISAAAVDTGIPEPRKPWLPDLATTYDLQFLGQRRDTELALGVVDDPARQEQRTVFFRPDIDGNMAIFGTSGAGKSAALRTLAVASGITPRSGPCQVYGLDFGTAGLRMLEPLAHVGSIVPGDDAERVSRLINWLRGLVDERSDRYAHVRAGTITEYRELSGKGDEPRILLLIDGLATLRDEYELYAGGRLFTSLMQVAAAGRPVGVHVVVTADRPNTVPPALRSSIQRRLVLRLADDDDYALVDVGADVLTAASPPGRGVIDGLDIQTAVLGGQSNVAEQSLAVEKLARTLVAHNVTSAVSIRSLPEQVLLSELPIAADGEVPVGISGETLQPLCIGGQGFVVVSGPPGSGTADVLAGLTHSVQRQRPTSWCGVIASARSGLGRSVDGAIALVSSDDVRAAMVQVTAGSTLVIEDAASLAGDEREPAVLDLVREINKNGGLVIAEAESSAWTQYSDLLRLLRSHRTGFLVQPDQEDGSSLLRTDLPRCQRRDFPVCGGMYVANGVAVKAQFVQPG